MAKLCDAVLRPGGAVARPCCSALRPGSAAVRPCRSAAASGDAAARPCCSAPRPQGVLRHASVWTVMLRCALLVLLALVCFFGPGRCIGEATNPGPAVLDLDDPEGASWQGDESDEAASCAAWSESPPLELGATHCREVPAFVAARKFAGARPGMVFKLGSQGIGYYRDDPPILELAPLLRPLRDIPPVVLVLDDLLGVEPCVHHTANPRAKRRRRARRGARRGLHSCRPTLGAVAVPGQEAAAEAESSEADDTSPWHGDGTLSAADARHTAAGLWAVDTVNPNAWPGALEYLGVSGADFVAIQECRVRSQHCADKEASARGVKWSVSVEPCIITTAGSTSSGVAVGARSHIGVSATSGADDSYSPALDGRFRVRRMGAVCRGGFHLGSVYLHDTVGVVAQCNLDLLQAVAGELSLLSGGWIVGGDWNCTPDELAATGWLDLVRGAICSPQTPTCNGKVYDFFVVKRDFRHAVHSVHAIGDAAFKPHSPVRLLLRGSPRCIMVRGLRRPRGFQAVLPHGPPEEPPLASDTPHVTPEAPEAPPDDVDVDAEYAELISRVESELSKISGHDSHEASAHAGRAKGLSFTWRNACGRVATAPPRATLVSLAWRRVSKWFTDLLRADARSSEAASLRQRILHYDHKLPQDPAGAQLEMWLGVTRCYSTAPGSSPWVALPHRLLSTQRQSRFAQRGWHGAPGSLMVPTPAFGDNIVFLAHLLAG